MPFFGSPDIDTLKTKHDVRKLFKCSVSELVRQQGMLK
jgi:hypothetical protein